MRIIKIIYHIIIPIFIISTIALGINVDQLIKQYGFFTSLRFLREWLNAGIVLFIIVYLGSSLRIFYLEKRIKRLKNDPDAAFNKKDL